MMQGPQANSCEVVNFERASPSFFGGAFPYHCQNHCSVIPLSTTSILLLSSHVAALRVRTQNPALDIHLDSSRNVTAKVGRRNKVIDDPRISPSRFSNRVGSVFGLGAAIAPVPASMSVFSRASTTTAPGMDQRLKHLNIGIVVEVKSGGPYARF